MPDTRIETVDTVVVGAGFAGLYAIHRLRALGRSLRCFETGGDVGGVWYWNRYPGARCDVESLQYSYSFSRELEQEWVWSERFAAQPEILAYIQHVADRFDLRRDVTFNTRVTAMTWDEAARLWEVETDTGERVRARFCIMASGSLSVTQTPDFPGADSFAGRTCHTGDWPKEPVDFSGKRVAVIGTGSSGIQAIPVIARQAGELFVFQRTPNFVVPARNGPLSNEAQRRWKEEYHLHRARAREVGTLYEFSTRGALDVDEAEREREYRRRWGMGGVNFVHSFNNIYLDEGANATAADFVRARIAEIVTDPETARKLQPTDHPLGSKRICVGTDYYETYNRPNVHLVDLRAEPLEQITPTGVRTATRDYPVDIIVYATGYDALTGALVRIDIRGRDGVLLRDKWAAGPANYLGLMTSGFPNLFVVTGPGSPSALVNMIVGIEQHIDWIIDCTQAMRASDATAIEPTRQAETEWVRHVNEEADKTLFVKAKSWYLGANIPGKPRVFLPYTAGMKRYRAICDEVAANGYRGFVITGGQAPTTGGPAPAVVARATERTSS
jgi:cyclohexanone monooxygenase